MAGRLLKNMEFSSLFMENIFITNLKSVWSQTSQHVLNDRFIYEKALYATVLLSSTFILKLYIINLCKHLKQLLNIHFRWQIVNKRLLGFATLLPWLFLIAKTKYSLKLWLLGSYIIGPFLQHGWKTRLNLISFFFLLFF